MFETFFAAVGVLVAALFTGTGIWILILILVTDRVTFTIDGTTYRKDHWPWRWVKEDEATESS